LRLGPEIDCPNRQPRQGARRGCRLGASPQRSDGMIRHTFSWRGWHAQVLSTGSSICPVTVPRAHPKAARAWGS